MEEKPNEEKSEKISNKEKNEKRTPEGENGERTAEECELSPEEILERAKKENEKLGDERQRGRMQWGNYAGFLATTLACVIVMLVTTFVNGEVPIGLMAILFTGIAAQNIAQACVYRACVSGKKVRVASAVCAALITVGAAIYWALWILELCGVSI